MAERPLACEAWQGALAGWLVAQLTPGEEAALADHLSTCEACRAEADSLLHVAAVTLGADALPAASGEPPPPDLGDRIVARVARERRARRAGRIALAMSAAAGAVVAGVLVARDPGEPALRGEPVAFVRQARGVDATAVLAADDGGGSLLELTATGLDPTRPTPCGSPHPAVATTTASPRAPSAPTPTAT
jgi:hypothetical protein